MRRFKLRSKNDESLEIDGVTYEDGYTYLRAAGNVMAMGVAPEVWSNIQNSLFGEDDYKLELID